MNSTTVYSSLALYTKKIAFTVAAIVLPLLVSLSRVMLGVHYPTDVLAGIVSGIILTLSLSVLQRRIKRRWLLYVCITIIASAGFFYCKSSDFFSGYGLLIGFFGADLFEQKFVNFRDTRIPWQMILRFFGGIASFLVVNQLLKLLPVSSESADLLPHLYRTFRYATAVFISIGVYPLSFRLLERHSSNRKEKRE